MKLHIVLTIALTLTCAAWAWQPAPDSMLTEWGAKLTPETAWPEYPRPALARSSWSNLNGLWKYQVTPKSATAAPTDWAGDILVPFAIESALSGVKKRINPEDALWYRSSFEAPARRDGQRTLLNFEAVDYQATVWVNDTQVGIHTGGNLPFSFDITSALKLGANTLTVRVTDATDTAYQPHGKQVSNPGGIWYTPVSGIWQTVWLETVPAVHITAAQITPAISGKVAIRLATSGNAAPQATVTASLAGQQVATTTGPANNLTLTIPNPKLWSPDSPTLYDLTFTVGADTVTSYVGLRETTVAKDADGHLRLFLNGKPLFHFGPLDQGWWPDGLLTPPSDAAMRSDIEFLKAAGFNTLRKHIKVEPRRYYTHCDRLGMMVWQDQVSSGTGKKRGEKGSSPEWSRLKPNPVDAEWPDAAHQQYMAELKIMMETLRNHPSIVQWVPFNEAWGQHRTVEVGKWAVAFDPTRQINIASGGNWFPVGHIVDHHQYPHPGFPFELGENGRFDGYVKIVGEFGGHGFPVEGHLWNPKARNWGYGGLPKDKAEWLERYKTSIAKLAELKKQGIAAGIYTQTTDVEGEINGLITYDRKVRKLEPAALAAIHRANGIPDGAGDSAAAAKPDPGALKIPKVEAAPEKPNIIVILVDDIGVGDFGFTGGKDFPTPNIDRFAREGVIFSHGYAMPSCSPTRAALLTGRYPQRFGIEDNRSLDGPRDGLDRSEILLPQKLREAGYATKLVGKWHLGKGNQSEFAPRNRGFDEFFGYFGAAGTYVNPVFSRDGSEKQHEGYNTDLLTDEACRIIKAAVGKPFFLHLAYMAAHHQQVARTQDLARVAHLRGVRQRGAAIMVNLDDNIGRLLDTLQQTGLDTHTLVFFISDNGAEPPLLGTSNGPHRGQKFDVLEGGIRVPFAARWPGTLPAGKRFDTMVHVMDVFPTALAAAGLTVPANLDGVNLLPFVLGKTNGVPHSQLCWLFNDHKEWRIPGRDTNLARPLRALREGNFKLVMEGDSAPELYDVVADPSEANNLAARQPERVAQMKRTYEAWRAQMKPQVIPDDHPLYGRFKNMTPGSAGNRKKQ